MYELMGAVRALDYKVQYKVCEAFYKLSKGFDWNDRLMFHRFEESLTLIDAEETTHFRNTVECIFGRKTIEKLPVIATLQVLSFYKKQPHIIV